MSKEALPTWVEDLARAFRAAGDDVVERSIFGGRAFFVGGESLVGMVELVGGQLRVRFREELRAELAARPHFDARSALPALLIITDDDRDYARSLAPKAYEIAKRPRAAARPPAAAPDATATRRRRPTR